MIQVKSWFASSSWHCFYLPFFLFLLLTVPDSDNFENKWKFVETSIFWDTLLIVIIWVYSVLQYCWIYSFLVEQPGMSDFTQCWSGCFTVRRRVEGQGGIKRVFAIVPLSFILYFEFCVQNLVPSSGLKDGSNNICPIRNQFQMSFVINRSWKFWVGRKGGYGGTPIRNEHVNIIY